MRVLLAAVLLALVAAAPAAARPPVGDWTSIRNDSYKHYACLKDGKGAGFTIRTASWFNGNSEMVGEFSANATVTRGSNTNTVARRTTNHWVEGYAFMTLRGVRGTDRLWMQSDGYGPSPMWTKGKPVRSITDCAS